MTTRSNRKRKSSIDIDALRSPSPMQDDTNDPTVWFDDLNKRQLLTRLKQKGTPLKNVRSLRKSELVLLLHSKTETKQARIQSALNGDATKQESITQSRGAFDRINTDLALHISSLLFPQDNKLAQTCTWFRARLSLSLSGTPSVYMNSMQMFSGPFQKPTDVSALLKRACALKHLFASGAFPMSPPVFTTQLTNLHTLFIRDNPNIHTFDLLCKLNECTGLLMLSLWNVQFVVKNEFLPRSEYPKTNRFTFKPWPWLRRLTIVAPLNLHWQDQNHLLAGALHACPVLEHLELQFTERELLLPEVVAIEKMVHLKTLNFHGWAFWLDDAALIARGSRFSLKECKQLFAVDIQRYCGAIDFQVKLPPSVTRAAIPRLTERALLDIPNVIMFRSKLQYYEGHSRLQTVHEQCSKVEYLQLVGDAHAQAVLERGLDFLLENKAHLPNLRQFFFLVKNEICCNLDDKEVFAKALRDRIERLSQQRPHLSIDITSIDDSGDVKETYVNDVRWPGRNFWKE